MGTNDSFNIKFDFSQIEAEIKNLSKLETKINASIKNLAMASYNQAIAIAKQKLHSTQKLFLDNLSFKEDSSGNYVSYLIILQKPAVWINDGKEELDMRQTHLKGKNSMVIPFTHKNEGMQPSTMSPTQAGLYSEIKDAMRKNKVSLQKPITDKMGSPILSSPGKPRAAAIFESVKSKKTGSKSGESVLNRLNIYQSQAKAGGKINKTMMTFRTLSKDGEADWIIPAYKAQKIMEETYNWILTNYNRLMAEGLDNIKVSLS